jgi:hypothetical protein
VRGGAIPLLAWGTLLVVLMVINWIWTGDAIQIGTFAFAATVVLGSALILILLGRRQAVSRGEPPATDSLRAVPRSSLASFLLALAVASIMFGLAFGRFLIYFGAGLLIVSLGAVWRELAAERRERRALEEGSCGRP